MTLKSISSTKIYGLIQAIGMALREFYFLNNMMENKLESEQYTSMHRNEGHFYSSQAKFVADEPIMTATDPGDVMISSIEMTPLVMERNGS